MIRKIIEKSLNFFPKIDPKGIQKIDGFGDRFLIDFLLICRRFWNHVAGLETLIFDDSSTLFKDFGHLADNKNGFKKLQK